MPYPILQAYLARLSHGTEAATSVRLDADGKAQGRFFNCTMTSAFQPVRDAASGRALGYEGLARSVSADDRGLSLWRLLDHAASDDESIELDRLCRMLHAINFFRQTDAGDSDLYLSVHDRLLSAVSSNHGYAFQRILGALGLPLERIVLQLPAVTPNQGWLLNYVADNYRRNGFRLAVNVSSVAQAVTVLDRLQPHAFKVDARALGDEAALLELLALCDAARVQLIFKRIESVDALEAVRRLAAASGAPLLVQGYLLDQPAAALAPLVADATPARAA